MRQQPSSLLYAHERSSWHLRVRWLGLVEDLLESLQHRNAIGKHSVCQEERVEKIDTEKPEIGQPLQQSFWRGGTDLRYLAGVQGTTESDVHVVFEQLRIVPDGLRHRDGAGVRTVEQIVEVNVVHALADVADPSRFFLR